MCVSSSIGMFVVSVYVMEVSMNRMMVVVNMVWWL